mgnify:CR=1 FL=1
MRRGKRNQPSLARFRNFEETALSRFAPQPDIGQVHTDFGHSDTEHVDEPPGFGNDTHADDGSGHKDHTDFTAFDPGDAHVYPGSETASIRELARRLDAIMRRRR